MAMTTFHESFGEVTPAQLAAYRKHNVSPSDHHDLADTLGVGNHSGITAAVKDPKNHMPNSTCFSVWKFWNE